MNKDIGPCQEPVQMKSPDAETLLQMMAINKSQLDYFLKNGRKGYKAKIFLLCIRCGEYRPEPYAQVFYFHLMIQFFF